MGMVLAVHGGAGSIPEELVASRRDGLEQALATGWQRLQQGEDALAAVVAAVEVMESLPQFNAGYGSTLTSSGTVEMDAGVMQGKGLHVGAVATISRVAHPIRLAVEVLHSPHILLAGAGAEAFAQSRNMPLIAPDDLISRRRRRMWEAWDHRPVDVMADDRGKTIQTDKDTVGAIALDSAGHVAAATSTGGMSWKLPGRVGDSPLVGAGFYADDALGAVSTTGWGETIARSLLGYRTVAGLEQFTPEESARRALQFLDESVQGSAGLILIRRDGEFTAAWNSAMMGYAVQREGEAPVIHQ